MINTQFTAELDGPAELYQALGVADVLEFEDLMMMFLAQPLSVEERTEDGLCEIEIILHTDNCSYGDVYEFPTYADQIIRLSVDSMREMGLKPQFGSVSYAALARLMDDELSNAVQSALGAVRLFDHDIESE